jgi:ectoine hydroxylase-related dioxygenase (phytanoyl-CoA dioxygenase family)
MAQRMSSITSIPELSYGVLNQQECVDEAEEIAEQVNNLGYAVVGAGYSDIELKNISEQFNLARKHYIDAYGESRLKDLNEFHTLRLLLSHGGDLFLKLALNEHLLSVLRLLISGKFILNQQNGIVNPPKQTYNQAAWHRDLPYQHFVSSKPLAINALFCVDDFTVENGATFVLPSSHKSEAFPSQKYIKNNAIQVEAKAGSFILLDCMMFHAGGYNNSNLDRRAVNHVYNIPFFKQQINIPMNIKSAILTDKESDILGLSYQEPNSVMDYLSSRDAKKY